MALPFELVLFAPSARLEGRDALDAELRRLANRAPVGVLDASVPEGELRARAAARHSAPVSLFAGAPGSGEEAGFAAALARAIRRSGLPAGRVLVVAADPAELEAAAAAGCTHAAIRSEPGALVSLVEALLARDEPFRYDPAWDALPYLNDYLLGIRLFNRRAYYEAHEAWENAWNADRRGDGPYYKGLIQFAVGTLHWERGNARGARRLYDEARILLKPFVPRHLGLDVVEFLDRMEDYFTPLLEAQAAGVAPPPPMVAEAPRIELVGVEI